MYPVVELVYVSPQPPCAVSPPPITGETSRVLRAQAAGLWSFRGDPRIPVPEVALPSLTSGPLHIPFPLPTVPYHLLTSVIPTTPSGYGLDFPQEAFPEHVLILGRITHSPHVPFVAPVKPCSCCLSPSSTEDCSSSHCSPPSISCRAWLMIGTQAFGHMGLKEWHSSVLSHGFPSEEPAKGSS
jgi:hypothetical protein